MVIYRQPFSGGFAYDYHLMIETPDANLAKGMKYLNQTYSQFFNWKYNRVGHLFQDRYKSYIVQKESYLLHCCRYIVLNPWEAGLVPHPKDWKWSNYRATAGLEKPASFLTTDWLLDIFGSDVSKATGNYLKFVEADITGKGQSWSISISSFLGLMNSRKVS